MRFVELTDEEIEELDAPPLQYVRPPVTTYPCDFCGNCEDPPHCVWSVVCPDCGALPKEYCEEQSRIVKLHDERWAYARQD